MSADYKIIQISDTEFLRVTRDTGVIHQQEMDIDGRRFWTPSPKLIESPYLFDKVWAVVYDRLDSHTIMGGDVVKDSPPVDVFLTGDIVQYKHIQDEKCSKYLVVRSAVDGMVTIGKFEDNRTGKTYRENVDRLELVERAEVGH